VGLYAGFNTGADVEWAGDPYWGVKTESKLGDLGAYLGEFEFGGSFQVGE